MARGIDGPCPHNYLRNPIMWITAVFPILVSIMLIHCGEKPSAPTQPPEKQMETVCCNGYEIHRFPSAEAQLRYALSRFSDPIERHAALEVVIKYFAEVKPIRAEAELELAYLKLGIDHRFTDRNMCMQALDTYRQIVARFSDLPQICAKAYWYMGWINADLLNQKKEGIAYYQTVYRRYPETKIKIESPVSWVVFVMPQIKTEIKATAKQKSLYWASLALLEIIRNSVREEERMEAFQAIWSDYRDSLAAGYALCVLLNGPAISSKVVGCAKEYLEKQKPSQPLADEIRKGLINKKPSMK